MPSLLVSPYFVQLKMLKLSPSEAIRLTVQTNIDRKTLDKTANGTMSPAKVDQLIADIDREIPGYKEAAWTSVKGMIESLLKDGKEEEFHVITQGGAWRLHIDAHEYLTGRICENSHLSMLRRLDEASIAVALSLRRGRFGEAIKVVESSVLAPYIDLPSLVPNLRRCEDARTFFMTLEPVRIISLLYLLALYERSEVVGAEMKPVGSGFAKVLPKERPDGRMDLPMRLLILKIEEEFGFSNRADAVNHLLESQDMLKTYSRWRSGASFPSFDNMTTLARNHFRLKHGDETMRAALAKGGVSGLRAYTRMIWGPLRYMTSLAEFRGLGRILDSFGGFNMFISRYEKIYEALG